MEPKPNPSPAFSKDYGHLADLAREHLAQGGSDTDVPEIEHGRVK